MSTATTSSTLVIDQTTVTSLLAALSLLIIAYVLSLRVLQPSTPTKLRVLFIWHVFDALIHFLFEGSFLYNCFFTYTTIARTSDYPHPASLTAPGVYFMGHQDRLYGSAYGTSPLAMLWQEYAKADKRWGGSDLGVISLELLTVFGAGPLAVVVCEYVRRGQMGKGGWFWATVLATGELYGGEFVLLSINTVPLCASQKVRFAKHFSVGFMTFAPEWLTGSPNLDTSNFMYLWIYLVFFNMLWVFFPMWVLYEAYGNIQRAFERADRAVISEVEKKKA